MEYKNVTKTIIGVATGKPIGLILNFGVTTQVYRIAQRQLLKFHIYSHTKAQSHKELFNMSI